MAKDKASSIAIPIDSYVLAKLKRHPVTITIDITLEAIGYDGVLRVRTQVSKPRVKRQKVAPTPVVIDAG